MSAEFFKGACGRCGGHIEFPATGAGRTIPCPHCGQPTTLMAPDAKGPAQSSRNKWWVVAIILACLASGAATYWVWPKKSGPAVVAVEKPIPAAPTNPPAAPPAAPAVPAPPPPEAVTNGFAIMPFNLEKTPGSSLVYVTGTVKNTSDRQRFGVKVEFELFDTNDTPIGSATDYESVLDPHSEWRFKALVMASRTVSARFHSIAEEQ